MRPHFFKGYSKKQNRMLTPDELALSGVYLGVDGRLAHHEDIKLLAFTGRQDINGRPVFETDVVDFDMVMPMSDDNTFATAQRRRGIVRWMSPPGWYGIEVPGMKDDEYVAWDAQNAMLVGNSLTTPELLNLPPVYGNPMAEESKSTEA